jgi:hypothetical protein
MVERGAPTLGNARWGGTIENKPLSLKTINRSRFWEAELTTWDTAESWFSIKLRTRNRNVVWCPALKRNVAS